MACARTIEILIVNYRSFDLCTSCIRSVVEQGLADYADVVVVDNNSGDGSADRIADELPSVRLIASPRNGGFGAGINLGMQSITAPYVLVLNPDTYFLNDSLSPVIDLMESDPSIGLVGLDLVNPDGSRQYSARRFYSLLDILARRIGPLGRLFDRRIARHLMRDAWFRGEPFDAEWVMGTGFVVRRSVFEAVGGMDEGFFLYMEDVDLCARVWGAGFRVVGMPSARLVHDHRRASASGLLSAAARSHLLSLVRFYLRYQIPLVRPPGLERLRR